MNTAIYCAREARSTDTEVQYVSAVGQDALSLGVLDLLKSEGVGTDYLTRDPDRQIGIYAIQNDAAGERSFHYWRETSAARRMFSADGSPHADAIAGADIAYLSGISIAVLAPTARDRLWRLLEAGRRTGLRVAFDSNYRPRLWDSPETARRETERFWSITDIALPSAEDEMALFGDADDAAIIRRISAAGASTGALKRGQGGPVPLDADIPHQSYRPATTVVDTTGAGDSFNGTYLAAIASGLPEAAALVAAHDLARRVVGHQGAIMPV